MIRSFCLLLLLICYSISTVSAQDKLLTLDDLVSPRFRPTAMNQLGWKGDSDQYTFVENNLLMVADSETPARSILSLEKLNESLPVQLNRFPTVTWKDAQTLLFNSGPQRWLYKLDTGESQLLSVSASGAANIEYSPAGHTAYTRGYNLYICESGSKQAQPITEDGDRQIVYGEPAHRVEFGIRNGSYWSPDGNQLAFYRIDQSMVTDYPIVKPDTKPARYAPVKYPMAGEKSHHATIGVYNMISRKTVYLKTGTPADQYLTNITWSLDGTHMYVAVVNRDQNHVKLNEYEVASGEFIRTLFEEHHEKYVEPEHGPIFIPGDSGSFLWFSERDGFNHLYQYHADGTLEGQITSGKWDITEFLGFDEKAKRIFYTGTGDAPTESHVFSTKLSNGKTTRITPIHGVHTPLLSKSGNFLLDTYTNLNTPKMTLLIENKKGEILDTLHNAPDPLADYRLGKVELFSIQAKDRTELHCRMIKPINFDPAKKYPVMIYVYGGPHVQLVQDKWIGGGSIFNQYMAQKGYVVFTLDNRGSAHRGIDFEQAVFRQLGTLEMEDQLTGVEFLKRQSFVDDDRIGVYGWSYGGFMSTSLMLRHPGIFKTAVAGGPVIDWKYYEVMYGERYMDTPQQNPEGYQTAALVNYVKNLDGRLLVIQGLQDSTVVPQHSNDLLHKAVEERKFIDYYAYPNHEHNVRGPERAHLYGLISRYFDDFLK